MENVIFFKGRLFNWALFFLVSAIGFGQIARFNQVEEPILDGQSNVRVVNQSVPVSVGLLIEPGQLHIDDIDLLKVRPVGGSFVDASFEETGRWHDDDNFVKWLMVYFQSQPIQDISSFNTWEVIVSGPSNPDNKVVSGDSSCTGCIASSNTGQITIDTGNLNLSFSNGLQNSSFLPGLGIFEDVLITARRAMGNPNPINLEFNHEIEKNSTQFATIKSTSRVEDLIEFVVRQTFFKQQNHINLSITYTVLTENLDVLRSADVQFLVDDIQLVSVGRKDTSPIEASNRLGVFQRDVKNLLTNPQSGPRTVEEGKLAGWLEINDETGERALLSFKDMWEQYPKGWVFANSRRLFLKLHGSERLTFTPEAIMRDRELQQQYGGSYFDFILGSEDTGTCPGQYHEWQFDDGSCNECDGLSAKFNAQGLSKTFSLNIFYDYLNTERELLHSLIEHPVLYRQEPIEFCARSESVFGFNMTRFNTSRNTGFPYLEKKLSDLGRLFINKWENALDYGNLRYGAAKWGRPSTWSYRTYDGTQYGLQIIPWMLYLRGGGREYFEEAVITSQHGMDVSTNHYSNWSSGSSGYVFPPGYQGIASSLPIFTTPSFLNKQTKIHFLSLYYHITGDRRAKETMDMIASGMNSHFDNVAGSLVLCNGNPRPNNLGLNPDETDWVDLNSSFGGREKNNQLSVWADLILEGYPVSPPPGNNVNADKNEIIRRITLGEPKFGYNYWNGFQYATNETKREFILFLAEGLLKQNQLNVGFPNSQIDVGSKIDDILQFNGFNKDVSSVRTHTLAPLAVTRPSNIQIAAVAWDVALGIADIIPEINEDVDNLIPCDTVQNNIIDQLDTFKSSKFGSFPLYHRHYQDYFLPMLTGMALAQENNFGENDFLDREDVLINGFSDDSSVTEVFISSDEDIDAEIELYSFFKTTGTSLVDCPSIRWNLFLKDADRTPSNILDFIEVNTDSNNKKYDNNAFEPIRKRLSLSKDVTYVFVVDTNNKCKFLDEDGEEKDIADSFPYFRFESKDLNIVYRMNSSMKLNLRAHKDSDTAIRIFFRPESLDENVTLNESNIDDSEPITVRTVGTDPDYELIFQTPVLGEDLIHENQGIVIEPSSLSTLDFSLIDDFLMLTTSSGNSVLEFSNVAPYFSTKQDYYFNPD